jgi:hypothetical protein
LHQATNLARLQVPLLLHGITITATPQRYSRFTRMQVARFDGTGRVPEGSVISAHSIGQQSELNEPLWRLQASLPEYLSAACRRATPPRLALGARCFRRSIDAALHA